MEFDMQVVPRISLRLRQTLGKRSGDPGNPGCHDHRAVDHWEQFLHDDAFWSVDWSTRLAHTG